MDGVEYGTYLKPHHRSGREILEHQYRNGLNIIERSPWAKNAYQHLLKRCAHLAEEEIIRLFQNRTQSQLELVIGAAIFREYNATHPPKASLRAGLKVKPVRRVGIVSFESEEPGRPSIISKPALRTKPRRTLPKPRHGLKRAGRQGSKRIGKLRSKVQRTRKHATKRRR